MLKITTGNHRYHPIWTGNHRMIDTIQYERNLVHHKWCSTGGQNTAPSIKSSTKLRPAKREAYFTEYGDVWNAKKKQPILNLIKHHGKILISSSIAISIRKHRADDLGESSSAQTYVPNSDRRQSYAQNDNIWAQLSWSEFGCCWISWTNLSRTLSVGVWSVGVWY